MIGISGIGGLNARYSFPGGGSYGGIYGAQAAVRTAQATGKLPVTVGQKKAAQPETPVERVRPAPPVQADSAAAKASRVPSWNLDAAEEAVRLRIQPEDGGSAQGSKTAAGLPGMGVKTEAAGLPAAKASAAAYPQGNQAAAVPVFPNAAQQQAAPNTAEGAWAKVPGYPGVDAGESAARLRIQYPGDDAAQGAEGVQKAAEEGRCETCEGRKYQDGSDDPGVSYQTPTRIAPENAASAVRGHEMEHVVREQAKAQREERRVVSQSVTLHTDICPECGKTYISGGTTRTVTAAKPVEQAEQPAQAEQQPKGPAGLV
ncbi:hypothetical protein D3Z52_15545 [Clostridiaceae bacterium]|nr:hypothetical protein [Clostridiaceae bacterium]